MSTPHGSLSGPLEPGYGHSVSQMVVIAISCSFVCCIALLAHERHQLAVPS